MMNPKRFFLIALGIFILLITGCDDGNVDNTNFITVKEETVSDNVDSLYLEWNSGVIDIQKGSGSEIKIEEKAKEDFLESNMFTFEMNGSQLKVLDPHYNHPVIMLEHDLTLIVPDKLYNEININGTSVQIDMESFKADNLILNTNTTEHNISGAFGTVTSEFTSGDINYTFDPLPKSISIKGYVSEGTMKVPVDSGFELTEEKVDSEIDSSLDLKEIEENKYTYNSGGSFITINMDRSEFNIEAID